MSAPVIEVRDDYQAEARALVEWLYGQAALYEKHAKHAPALKFYIQRLRDAAALLDAFQAGLLIVPPHPLMRAELVQWVDPEKDRPPLKTEFLVFVEGRVHVGFKDEHGWIESGECGWYVEEIDAWAEIPRGPVPAPTPESRHAEEDASCA